jgi:dATP pyrophosphohydrolase
MDGELTALDARTMIPVVAVTGELTWGPNVLVIPEYAFGLRAESGELRLSHEHTEYGWFSLDEACKMVRWDSNRTALWELDHRLAYNRSPRSA